MTSGNQFRAPNGYGSMVATETYYLMRSDPNSGECLFCWFSRRKSEWRVYLMSLTRVEFEAALTSIPPLIVPSVNPKKLPPWLSDMDGTNFDELEMERQSAKRTYRDQVNDRYQHISLMVANSDLVLLSENPMKVLSKHALQCSPPQNPHRVQLWFFTYLVHGRNIWSLKKPTFNAGRWSREAPAHEDRKFGRPCLNAGSSYGYPTHKMREAIFHGYIKRAGLGVRMTDIHADTLVQDMGCKVEKKEGGLFRIYHPKNLPFPSYYQFRKAVIDLKGLKQVQATLYGKERVKHSLPHQGAYTERLSNLLESLEVDAFRVGDRASSMYSDDPMSVLCVARGICATSGEVVGIGMSLGSETSEAYRAMLFSMAIPKSKLGELFGLPITDEEWPAQGLSQSLTSDRGPGSKDLATELEESFPMREITPSNSGQSKALVESSQPKKTHTQGAKKFKLSRLNAMEMARREVLRACSDNHTSSVSKRLTPDMIEHFSHYGLPATPHNLWKYMSNRMRTDGVSIPFDQAVRAFCTPTKMMVRNDGVWLGQKCFRSEELASSGLLERARPGLDLEVRGYVLQMAVRTLWIENAGKIMELNAVLRLRDDAGQLMMTLDQLLDQNIELARIESTTRESAQAAKAEYRGMFKEAVGKDWDAGEMKTGAPKRPSGTTAHEERVVKGPVRKEKRA